MTLEILARVAAEFGHEEIDEDDYRQIVQRFESYTDKNREGCWEWRGEIVSNGYGRMRFACKRAMAHRLAYTLLVGDIPDHLQLDHLCRNRACVNPFHLEPVTVRENLMRGVSPSAINNSKTVCIRGHRFTHR